VSEKEAPISRYLSNVPILLSQNMVTLHLQCSDVDMENISVI
jgi:hypothetical protein